MARGGYSATTGASMFPGPSGWPLLPPQSTGLEARAAIEARMAMIFMV